MLPECAPLAAFCLRTGQPAPEGVGGLVRCVMESLALKYRWAVAKLEGFLGTEVRTLHVVGGGSRNGVLNQFVADCTGRVVIAGPSEATALGNILTQAMGAGELSGLDEIREVVRASCAPVRVEPRPSPEWDRAYEGFTRT